VVFIPIKWLCNSFDHTSLLLLAMASFFICMQLLVCWDCPAFLVVVWLEVPFR
jgi:hypothetical protein